MRKILFIYKNRNLAEIFKKHLLLNNFDVTDFYDINIPYNSFTIFQKLENIVYRVFFKNKNHIHNIYNRIYLKYSNKRWKELNKTGEKYDYCLIIRGDLIPENIIHFARKQSKRMIDFQLDGLSVSEKILDYRHLFDELFVFDKDDLIKYPKNKLSYITNCYFPEKSSNTKKWDIYYTGALAENRLKYIENLIHNLKDEYRYNINLGYGRDIKVNKNIKIIHKHLPYEENLKYTKESRVLLDIKRNEHNGLSLRFFEAMSYHNKIITNNLSVRHYDFYNPKNIFITDYKNFDGLEEFLNTPYEPIPDDIKLKYRFDNWIKYILGDKSATPISLPKE